MTKYLLLGLSLAVTTAFAQVNSFSIIPQPTEIQALKGSYVLSKNSSISYNQTDGNAVADYLAQRLNTPTGFAIPAKQGSNGTIQLTILTNPNAQLGKEGYSMEVTPAGVRISANSETGLFYGVQTLLQLLPAAIESKSVSAANWLIPAVKITDVPRFGWRGLMLDVSRNFFTVEEVKQYIDELSRLKFNTFHWHLTDDEGWRIEIKSLPKLTEVGAWRVPRTGHFGDREAPKPGEAATYGGFYTQAQIREVIAFAATRHVTIVPEIDVPGHSMAAIAAYPELSCQKDPNTLPSPGMNFADWFDNGTFRMNVENALNPADEKVYTFLDKVFTEVAALFPGQYIHVGGDECYKGYWAKDPGCKALMKTLNIHHVEDLQGYFMGRLEKILAAKGKRLLGWDEILDGGISPNATVMSWRGIQGGIEAAGLGHEVVMSPTTFAYLDYNQGDVTIDPPIYASIRVSKSYSFEPVPEGVDPKYILGGQGNLWSEQLPNYRHVQYMTYPRAWALSEVYWSPKSAKNWDDFSRRMEAHFERADVADMNYSKAVYDPIVLPRKEGADLIIELGSEIQDIDVFFSTDDSMPDSHSPKYSKPFKAPDGPITLRVQCYRKGKPIGHLLTLKRSQLEERAKK